MLLALTSLACLLTDILPDPCSDDWLITKINLANANPDTTTINFDPGCIYEFDEADDALVIYGDNALPVISTPIVIHGNGATITRSAAEGTPEFRFFFIDTDGSLTLEDVTVTNGYMRDAFDIFTSGGAILSHQGSLTIIDSTFTDNYSKISGGAIVVVGSSLTITNSTFTGNLIVREGGSGGRGGAVAVHEGTQMTVTGSEFTDNLATGGGAIYVFKTSSAITGSTFADNDADGSGGGAVTSKASELTIADSEFTSNYGGICCGAIEFIGHYFDGYTMTLFDVDFTITGSTFTENEAYEWSGAISLSNAPNLTITDSTFDGNQAASLSSYYYSGLGGAIYIREVVEDVTTNVSINESTFSSNRADEGSAIYDSAGSRISIETSTFADNIGDYGPGGILTDGNLNILNSTFTGNTGDCSSWGDGACGVAIHTTSSAGINYTTVVNNSGPSTGAAVFSQGGVIKINGSIIANNIGGDCGSSEGGSIGSSSASLDSDGSCLAPITADPLVHSLADNGGLTQTHALQSGSPAIDAGPSSCPATDQRGVLRPFPSNGNCDLGAYEVSIPSLNLPTEFPPLELVTITPTPSLSWIGTVPTEILCYQGPDPAFDVVSSLQANSTVNLVGFSEQGNHVVLDNPRYPGVNCYVKTDQIDIAEEVLALLPTIPDPKPPTPTPTSTPPTPTVTSPPPATGSISGVVFQDNNYNGNQQVGEAGKSGVTVHLGQGACASSGYQSIVSSGSGSFSFTNLPAGTYCLSVSIPLVCDTYSSPTTSTQYTINLGPGGSVSKLFGYATFPC